MFEWPRRLWGATPSMAQEQKATAHGTTAAAIQVLREWGVWCIFVGQSELSQQSCAHCAMHYGLLYMFAAAFPDPGLHMQQLTGPASISNIQRDQTRPNMDNTVPCVIRLHPITLEQRTLVLCMCCGPQYGRCRFYCDMFGAAFAHTWWHELAWNELITRELYLWGA